MEALSDEVVSNIISNGLSLQDLKFLTADDVKELAPRMKDRIGLRELVKKCKNGIPVHIDCETGSHPSLSGQACTTFATGSVSSASNSADDIPDHMDYEITPHCNLSGQVSPSLSRLVCPICPYERTCFLSMKLSSYLRHIQDFHAHEPSFQISCGMYGCPRIFKKFSSLRTHVYEHHGGDPMVTNQRHLINATSDRSAGSQDEATETMEASNFADISDQEPPFVLDQEFPATPTQSENYDEKLQNLAAKMILGLREKHKLTQVATQGIVEDTTNLFQVHMRALYQQLVLSGIAHDCLSQFFADRSPLMDPFTKVKSTHYQLKFYREHLGLIEPIRIKLGERQAWKGTGYTRRSVIKSDELMYVPVLNTLQNVLQKANFLAEIEKGHQSTTEYMYDFCDGSHFKNHPLFSVHTTALQIYFYFDDLETCNPLGSKAKKHKLSMFYFTLGNLPPAHRSKLTSIYLVAIAKQKLVGMYGMDALLRPFVEDIKKLEQGYTFHLKDGDRKLYGTIALISADNLGSLALGGFKESCSAKRMCRHCMATREKSKTKFNESDFKLRTPASHKRHCKKAEESLAGSMKYGINRDSILNELRYFNVCGGGLLPDIMHDILEGALQLEVKLMLQKMIYVDKYFTLDIFNSRLENIELGYMEMKDKPTKIAAKTLKSSGHSLKQQAAQMWLLGRILPILIGDLVPDDDNKWANFLLMMEIVDILFSPKLTEDHAAYLSVKIVDHHTEFAKLYGNEFVIPKIHFMIHMARLTLEFGPLICFYTMRYEAKHSYFKSIVNSIGNFINLPYTLAMRHQQQQCYFANTNGESSVTIGPVQEVSPDVLLQGICESGATVFEAKWVVIDGKTYKIGAALIESENKVMIIKKIFMSNDNIIFKGKLFSISYYHTHFRAYELRPLTSPDSFMMYATLTNKIPIHPRKCRVLPQNTIIILPYNIFL